jgi:hypothetical protein
MDIRQVVLWGHKLHSHTHSYIHNGFYLAFQHMGYTTLWLDNSDDISSIDFSKSFFITEGQVDQNIPIVSDSYYVLHNCDMKKYEVLPISNYMVLQVYTHDVITKHMADLIDKETLSYYKNNCLWTTWATDLFPNEINANIELVKTNALPTENMVVFVGSFIHQWYHVKHFCDYYNIPFTHYGGYNHNNLSVSDNIALVQKSLLAPSIQCDWQCDNGYIPCRIFKNISYGKMGITNNPTVFEMFNQQVVFDRDINNLLCKGLDFEKLSVDEKNSKVIPLMELVRDKHTYINRIQGLFKVFLEIKQEKVEPIEKTLDN